jgi:hypothetical protein
MKLFKVWQTVNDDYDTYDSMIVCAESWEDAIMIHPDNFLHWDQSKNGWFNDGRNRIVEDDEWTNPENVYVVYIGEAENGTEKGVILASFNAG